MTTSDRQAARQHADHAAQRADDRDARPSTDAAGRSNYATSAALRGGVELDPRVREDMEARFGESFDDVRVHDDDAAHEHAAALQAKAFTVGEHVVFGSQRYAPDAPAGKRLLAHELAHVVQQRRGGPSPSLDPQASHEASADQAASAAVSGASAVEVGGGTSVGVARDVNDEQRKLEEEEDARPKIASPTALTQRRPATPKLDLPVHEINDPNKGKGTRAEVTVPFDLFTNPEWSVLAGGAETASSRTSIARKTRWGDTAGIDYLAEHRETDLLVIGEQKAVKKGSFEKATAITTSLDKNIAQASEALQKRLDKGQVHPEEVANVKRTIAKLDATAKALKNGTDLPEGVVFELTNVGGEGKSVGKNHIKLLAKLTKRLGHDQKFLEHLLSRTQVRDPKLAKAKGRPAEGKRGTASDPDVVPASELLTPEAKEDLERRRQGKSEKDWKKQKKQARAAKEAEQRKQRKAATAAKRQQRQQEMKQAKSTAKKAGADARKQKLEQLREQRAQSGEAPPKTKKQRDAAKKAMEREVSKTGKAAERKSLDDFKAQRKQQDAQKRTQRQAEETARKQKAAAKRQASASEKAKAKQAKQQKKQAIKDARAAGSLDTPESLRKMNEEARAENRRARAKARPGQVAHVANQAAAGVRAYDAYDEAREQGKGRLEAGAAAVTTYLENTNPILGTIATAQMRQQKDASGQQYYGDDAIDAWLGTVGEVGAGYILPGGAADQLVNAGANVVGAVDDHMKRGLAADDPARNKANIRTATDLAADLTPSRMFSQTIGGGLRASYDVGRAIGGDTKGVDKFAEDAVRGKLGSVIQPWAMAGDFVGNLGSDDVGTALAKTVKKTEGTTLTKLGYASGDSLYEFGQNKEAKAGKHGTATQGLSQLVGISSDLIAGQSFEKALQNAADAGKGSLADKVGGALGDAMFDTVEKGREILNEDLPAAKKRAGDALRAARRSVSTWWNDL